MVIEGIKEEIMRLKQQLADSVMLDARDVLQRYIHTELICDVLQRVVDGEQLSILIEMPPRHGKSMTVTESFPSF